MLEAGHTLVSDWMVWLGLRNEPWGELPMGTARCSWALAPSQALSCRASSSLCSWGAASQEGSWGFL